MARKPRLFAPGVLYHVIVRGNQRQNTFLKDSDYQIYLEKLAAYKRKYLVTIYAYCLMPNHVHLLLECSSTPLAKFMQGVQQSYTQYYNRTYKKVGHLFQGRYKAILCQKDAYLLELVRYIHLNPFRSKLVKNPQGYRYSGEDAYRAGNSTAVIDCGAVLKVIGGTAAYRQFVQDGMGEGHKEEFYAVEDQRFLGEKDFGEALREEKAPSQEKRRRSLAGMVADIGKTMKVAPEGLSLPHRGREASQQRIKLAYILVRRGGFKVNEVAQHFRRDATTISVLLSRYESRLQEQPELRKAIDKVARLVNL